LGAPHHGPVCIRDNTGAGPVAMPPARECVGAKALNELLKN
jgi:hypothetical protein